MTDPATTGPTEPVADGAGRPAEPVTHVVLRAGAVGLVVSVLVVSTVLVVRTGLVDGLAAVVWAYLDWLTGLPARLW